MSESAERTIQQLGELSAKYTEAQRNAQKAMALFKETRQEEPFSALPPPPELSKSLRHYSMIIQLHGLLHSSSYFRASLLLTRPRTLAGRRMRSFG